MNKKATLFGFLALGVSFSAGLLGVSADGGDWGLGGSLSLDVTKPISKGFAWVNSKLPATAAPIEALVESTVISAIKAIV